MAERDRRRREVFMQESSAARLRELLVKINSGAEHMPPFASGGVIHGPWHCMASDRWSMISPDGRQYCEYWRCTKDEEHDGPHHFEPPR